MISLAPVKRAPRRVPEKAATAPETASGRSERLEALRQRRRAFFAKPIDFIPCRQFLAADAADAVARVPAPPPVTTTKAPADTSGRLSAYVAGLYRTRLLSREEEQFHFRRLNWLKFRAATERGRLDEKRATDRQMDAVEKLLADAEASRSLLITSNLRLVVSIAKKFVNPDDSFDELVAEGNVALMRSVDKFDFSLGNRFSTYATYAIQRHFFRLSHRGRQQRRRYTPADESLRSVPETEGPVTCSPGQVDLLATLFRKFLGELEPREREIVVARFGFDGRPPRTFRELGAEMGVCKERIRQIQSRAMDKIRGMAAEARLEQTVGDWL